ncbi:transcription termination/antitermination NusG family protein [Devosia sp. 2618]|uniref:transcription termination/antitermination NusG family protein n=1 Tax=Devosia sp. 2618 TaxID=3156454 RepID=UPI003397DF84
MGKRVYEDDEYHWYALDVVRQKEYVAGHILNRMGCVTFIPTESRFRKKTRYSKGKMEVAHASIPGTIFVGFPEAPNWFRVMALHVVNGVLSVDHRPRRIDTASREWIKYRGYQTDGHLTVERHKVMVKVNGEQVEVERSVPLISMQGRGVIRSSMLLKSEASSNRPMVITVSGERAKKLQGLLDWSNKVGMNHVEAA